MVLTPPHVVAGLWVFVCDTAASTFWDVGHNRSRHGPIAVLMIIGVRHGIRL
jgi:hypothetical protein